MKIELAYGSGSLPLTLEEDRVLEIIGARKGGSKADGQDLVRQALGNPIGTPRLKQIIEQNSACSAVVVVNDLTRPTPNRLILPPLLEELERGGINPDNITLIIATGIHRQHTVADNITVFGDEICRKYRIENHNCDGNLVSLGVLSNGMDLVINRTVAEADLLVTIGVVGLHYFAGYSGGRKSILPGVAARSVIEANHKMMSDKRARLGNYEDNPVSDLMLEAARIAGVDFILNVVTQAKHEIAFCAAGEVGAAWLKAVHFCEEMNTVIVKQPADIVIASCGGYPKDINMYQAQKALDSALLPLKSGGTIILVAECREGLGEATFQEWVENSDCPQDIVDRFNNRFELGGHKAYAICRILDQAQILLLSDLPDAVVEKLYMTPVRSLDKALHQAILRNGPAASVIIMPEAGNIAVKLSEQA